MPGLRSAGRERSNINVYGSWSQPCQAWICGLFAEASSCHKTCILTQEKLILHQSSLDLGTTSARSLRKFLGSNPATPSYLIKSTLAYAGFFQRINFGGSCHRWFPGHHRLWWSFLASPLSSMLKKVDLVRLQNLVGSFLTHMRISLYRWF